MRLVGRPLIDIDLLVADEAHAPVILTLARFFVGPQGPPGSAANLAIDPNSSIGFESDNIPDGLIEIATDTHELNKNFPFHELPPLP